MVFLLPGSVGSRLASGFRLAYMIVLGLIRCQPRIGIYSSGCDVVRLFSFNHCMLLHFLINKIYVLLTKKKRKEKKIKAL